MEKDSVTLFLGLLMVFSIVLAMMLFAYEDGVPMGLYKRLRCKFGWHKIHKRIGRLKIHRYYCEFCRKPRSHPQLKSIDGGKKLGNTKFRF